MKGRKDEGKNKRKNKGTKERNVEQKITRSIRGNRQTVSCTLGAA